MKDTMFYLSKGIASLEKENIPLHVNDFIVILMTGKGKFHFEKVHHLAGAREFINAKTSDGSSVCLGSVSITEDDIHILVYRQGLFYLVKE